MLTADLVRARRKNGQLLLPALDARTRVRAVALARGYIERTRESVGATREEVAAVWAGVDVTARDRKLADGLCKLVEDRCTFEAEPDVDPSALRAELFGLASARRAALDDAAVLDREALVAEVAEGRGIAPSELERLLYADLRGAHRLLAFDSVEPSHLVDAWDVGRAQAVLLRAVRVEATVRCRSAAGYRYLFRKLKFLRLLHHIEPAPDGGYHIAIDGPLSLFGPVTKYGLSLALALPALRACDRFTLRADVRWGRDREPLQLRLEGGQAAADGEGGTPSLPEEVEVLLERWRRRKTPWRVRRGVSILSLPGVGVCVPDLSFQHAETGARVHLEVLGYWSRAAVWRRVELVEAGLTEAILFAVPSRLRVSEEVLGGELPGALYVYKGSLLPKAIEARLDALAGRLSESR